MHKTINRRAHRREVAIACARATSLLPLAADGGLAPTHIQTHTHTHFNNFLISLVSYLLTHSLTYFLTYSLTRANEATSGCQTPDAKHNLAATDTRTRNSHPTAKHDHDLTDTYIYATITPQHNITALQHTQTMQ